MKITRNKAVTLVTVILLSLMITSIFAVDVNAAQQGAGYCYNYIFLNPDGLVGVGQKVSITVWVHRPNAGNDNNLPDERYFHNFTVVIHRPDGKIDYALHNPLTDGNLTIWDTTAVAYGFYTPDIVGNYTFEFYFPNQTTVGGSLAGFYYTNYNATAYLKVQQDPLIQAQDSYPLPSEYWYRPIESQNSWWAGFPGSPTSNWYNSVRDRNYNDNPNNRYQPDGIAPAAAHIMWSAPMYNVQTSHLDIDPLDYYTSPIFSTQIIMNGLLYYQTLDPDTWNQFDLRTGQLINASQSMISVSFGYAYDMESQNSHGVLQAGFLFAANYSRAMEAGNLQIGHGWTWTMNPLPRGAEAVAFKGEHVRMSLVNVGTSSSPRWVVRNFNTSKAFGSVSTSLTITSYTTQNWSDWQRNVINKAGVPVILGNDSIEVGSYTVNDNYNNVFTTAVLLCKNGTLPSTGSNTPVTYFAIAFENQTIGKTKYLQGQLMWMKNINAPSDGSSLVQGPTAEGLFTLVSPETGTWYGYDIITGDLLWTTEPQTNVTPYGYTPATTATGCTVSIGDPARDQLTGLSIIHTGKLVTAGLGGVVFCYNLADGTLLWHKAYPLSVSASVANYPTNIGLLCDGKVYLGTFNPSATEPLLSGSMVRCLNVTNGEELWSLPGFGSPGGYAVSDGYMVFANYYDMNVYCVGKGPSAMTISSSPDVAHNGAPVTITGTCLDASPNTAIKGTAAISDESMGAWMAYKFMGQPMPTDVTGVTVYLSTIDPNNNQEFIGTATVNSDGTFNYEWTPPVPGTYQLTAQFLGSNSYFPSMAHSTLHVTDNAAPTTNPTAAPQPTMTNTYLAASAGAIIATLIAVVAVILLMLRKRP